MRNTMLADTDLIFYRPPKGSDDEDGLTEIQFEDMEPIEAVEFVGVEPHAAVAILPYVEFVCVGVHPYGAVTTTPAPAFPRADQADLIEDAIPTEEFSAWEHELVPA